MAEGATPPKSQNLFLIFLRSYFVSFTGLMGVACIGFGVISAWSQKKWPPLLEEIFTFTSSCLTLIGTIITALTVFFVTPYYPPERSGKLVAYPVIGGCILGLYFLLTHGSLPTIVVNGFALMAIAGALFRILPQTTE